MTDLIGDLLVKIGSLKPRPPEDFDTLETYTVKKVSDADTIDAIAPSGEEITVRFVYIDAPETPKGWGYKRLEDANKDNRLYQTQFKWGEEGKRRAKQLIEESNNRVKLRVTDIDTRYGRRIAEVYLLDGTFMQHLLVKEGLARIYYDYFNKCPRELAIILLLAEAEAEREKQGLWQESRSEFISPWLFRSLKSKQKKLIKDPEESRKLLEEVQLLAKDWEANRITQAEFEKNFKQILK